ncbi:uncharacterized protein LOC117791198 [Drosophila innubila]|uniref:uncharacterized protein LOC117791198 n=1 Tax=Drosophila innubila TaxID=198719 RepID=UPI00148DD0BD|nr:uncharacterized protein LOC117791198 [Drosophila innubila]
MHHSAFLVILLEIIARINGTMIYPELAPTPVTFLCAIGIPVEDLAFETVISGYALRMQYFLPNNASQLTRIYLKPQPLTDRRYINKSNLGSMYRWIIYRAIEMVLQNLGLPGHSCLLRAICDHAALPLTYESGLLGEILHIILTPSSSRDQLGAPKDRVYQTAEHFGRRGGNCELAYANRCPRSPIDLISILLKLN